MIRALSHATRRAIDLFKIMLWVPFAIVVFVQAVKLWNTEANPAQRCFNPREITVENAVVGDPVWLRYDRSVDCHFIGTYRVVVVDPHSPDAFAVCDNSETIPYSPRPKTLPLRITLTSFVGEQCNPPPGTYQVKAQWVIERLWHMPVTLNRNSNIFIIDGIEERT